MLIFRSIVFMGLFQVKADNELSSDLSIPMVIQSKQKLDLLCRQVDSLEIFINRVKSDMEIIETQVQEAEEEMGQPNGRIKSMIKPLLVSDVTL